MLTITQYDKTTLFSKEHIIIMYLLFSIYYMVTHTHSEDGNGDEGNGNEGRVGDGEKEAKKRKKPLNSCRRQGGNGGDFGGTRKRCRKGSVGPVAANSNIVEINKEAGGGAQGTLSLSKNCTSRESVSPLSRLIRGFRNKYH